MRSRRPPIDQLRTAIDCLPVGTRVAMLEGVRANDIIVGAYTDGAGGVCPMLAAHRCGGRTSFIGFAKAWDRFATAGRVARRASRREVRVLTAHLEASILAEDEVTADFKRAIAEHRSLVSRRGERERPGDPDRTAELASREGWAWMRPFRRYDEYARALARVEAAEPDRELAAVGPRATARCRPGA
jgi:hypothetical protein